MSTQTQLNRKKAEHFFNELWFGNNLSVIDQYIAKSAIIRSPLLLSIGKDAKQSIVETWFASFPKVTNVTQDFFTEKDTVIVRWRNMAVQKDTFCGMEPHTDAAIEYSGISCYKLRSGLIVEYHAYVDLAALCNKNFKSNIVSSTIDGREQLLRQLQNINATAFTAREIENLSLWVSGISSKSAGQMLNISHKTVESYRDNIRNKFQIYNKEQLFNYLDHQGVLQLLFYFGRNYIVNVKQPLQC